MTKRIVEIRKFFHSLLARSDRLAITQFAVTKKFVNLIRLQFVLISCFLNYLLPRFKFYFYFHINLPTRGEAECKLIRETNCARAKIWVINNVNTYRASSSKKNDFCSFLTNCQKGRLSGLLSGIQFAARLRNARHHAASRNNTERSKRAQLQLSSAGSRGRSRSRWRKLPPCSRFV